MSDSLEPHGHAAHQPPLSSSISQSFSNSCLLNQWCYLTVSSPVTPFSFCLPKSHCSSCSCLAGPGAASLWFLGVASWVFSPDSLQSWHWPSGKLPKQEHWSRMGTEHLCRDTEKSPDLYTGGFRAWGQGIWSGRRGVEDSGNQVIFIISWFALYVLLTIP